MRILEIELMFQNEETLNKVLEECKEDFELVDEWSRNLKANIAGNPEEALRGLTELSGAFSGLRTVLGIAVAEKRNREGREYNRIRIETENAEKKFVSAVTEQQASTHVANYRRIRNIVEAYTESCKQMIVSLQSNLKYQKEESKNPE